MASVISDGKITNAEIKDKENCLAFLHRTGVFLDAPCGGRGHCGKCKVILKGTQSTITDKEKVFLSEKDINNGIRLACFAEIQNDAEIKIISGKYEIETKMTDLSVPVNISENAKLLITGNRSCAGMAVDIGTTTIAAFFYDLKNGKKIYTTSALNPQKAYGADVMSRINYAIVNVNGLRHLNRLVINQLNSFIAEFSAKFDYDIIECTIDGNTTMELIACGYDIRSLGYAPYKPESLLGLSVKAQELGLNINPLGDIYFMPAVSGFIGGDTVAVMLALNFDNEKKSSFAVDIGTNGEMALLANGEIYAASAAAGPALEGSHIRFGTGSIEGAVNKVEFKNNTVQIHTIGNKQAIGICGSGLIDSVALIKNLNVIDETGKIDDESEYVNKVEGQSVFLLTQNIYITQKDIREIQLAKAAISAGAECLLKEAGIKNWEVDKIYVAGGFGTAINLSNAEIIGLLPENFCSRGQAVGNAAGFGASLALLNVDYRRRAEKLASGVKVIELTEISAFQDLFAEKMMF